MQRFPVMMASFTVPVDKPGLGSPAAGGRYQFRISGDAAPILLRQPMRHFPEHNMIDVSERGRGEVRVFVERRPVPNWRSTISTFRKIMITREGLRQFVRKCFGILFWVWS